MDTTYLVYASDIAAGRSISGERTWIGTKFDHISFVCTYTITDGYSYYDQFEFEVTPHIQYGWNDVVIKK